MIYLRRAVRRKKMFVERDVERTCRTHIKKERLYIDEWVDYHLGLGFEKIYIYDNSVDFDMRGWEVMKNQEWFGCEPARRDVVKVFHFPGDMQQTSAYDTCTLRARDEGHEWAAFFDVDEFLVLHQHADVVTFLEEYCSVGALGISWRYFGTNNETEYTPLPVTKRFTLGAAEPDRHIKSIAKLDHVLEVGHVHFVTKFMANYCTIDTNRRRVDGPFNLNPPSNIAVLHHYHTKSVGEYRLKRARGRADINCSDSAFTEPCEQLHIMSTTSTLDTLPVGEKFDDLVWQTLKYNIPAYKDGSPKNGTSRC